MTSLIAPIVQVCDAISAPSRCTPRNCRGLCEAFERLGEYRHELSRCRETYAIQAGRELRVIVGADKIDDKEIENLSNNIATRIQNEMTYPGQVKITVIRETRSVSYAK